MCTLDLIVQIGLLYRIFETLGTPSETSWPDFKHTKYWQAEFPQWKGKDLRQVRCPPSQLTVIVPASGCVCLHMSRCHRRAL